MDADKAYLMLRAQVANAAVFVALVAEILAGQTAG